MEDSNSINVANDHHVQNTNVKPSWHTVQNNGASLITEDVKRVIKVETDLYEDCTWESRIDNTKVDDPNGSEVPLNNQNVPENNSNLNDDNTNHNQTFICNVCKDEFVLHYQLKIHMEKHHKKPIQVNSKSNECKFCGKQFKLNFVLNRHIEKFHINLTECEVCKCIVNKSVYNEHLQTHENGADKKINLIPNLKLCKLNGVWKSKPNCVFKCKICFEKFGSQNNLTEHMKTHEDDDGQIQWVDELNGHMQFHNKNQFKCQKCDLRFDNKQTLNIHVSNCTKSSQNIWSKFRGQPKANIQTSHVCTICGNSYTNSLLLRHHVASGCKNYSCKYCGTIFNTKELWSNHMDEFQMNKNCIKSNMNSTETSANILQNQNLIVNDINQSFNNENGVSTYVTGRNNLDQIDIADIGATKINKSIVQTVSHNLMTNDSSVNASYENSLYTNVTENNNSDQSETGPVSSEQSMVQGVSQKSILNNYIVNIKKEKGLCSNTNTVVGSSLNQINAADSNGSIVPSVSPHNSIVNYCGVYVKKEKSSCTITSRKNNFDQMNAVNNNEIIAPTMNNNCLNIKKEKTSSMENYTPINRVECYYQSDAANSIDSMVQVTSHTSTINYCDINIKKEKCLHNNVNENSSSDLMEESNGINELSVLTVPQINLRNVRVKQEPENHHDSITLVKKHRYFTIHKLADNYNFSCITRNEIRGHALNNNMKYTCTICITSTTDLHSFALHMSTHLECSIHECIVCDQKFVTVLLWKNHMTYHQQQLESDFLNSQINPTEVESNTTSNTIYSPSLEPKAHSSTLKNRVNNSSKLKIDLKNSSTSNIKRVNNGNTKFKKSLSCDICKKIFHSMLTFRTHQTLHDKSRQICCKYCDRTFSSRGPCTNHEKSHNPNGYKNAVKNTEHKTIEIQNKIIANINANPILTVRKKKKKPKSKFSICDICRKRFSKRCYLTNHLKLRHHIHFKLPIEQIADSSNLNNINNNVNGNKSTDNCKEMELSMELGTNSSVPVDGISNNLVSEISHQHSTLNSHLTIHPIQMYTCPFCSKHFYKKISLSNHLRCHNNKKVKSVNSKHLNIVKIERCEEHQQRENFNSSEFDNTLSNDPSTTNLTMTTALMNHVTTHSDHELHKCKFCDRKFIKKSSLTNHIKSHCNKKFKHANSKNLSQVKIERNEEYQQGRNPNISEFVNSSSIEPNIANLTKKNRLWFPCDVCEKKFSTPFLLVIHRRSHCGIEPYLCKICNRSYTVRHRWNRHLKSHYWRKKLKNKSTKQINVPKLETGTLITDPVQHKNLLKCVYCKKEYSLKSQLKKHLSMNKECRRYCKSSHPEFTSNQTSENFTKSTRFECHICKKTYSTLYNRKVHLVNVHKLSLVDLNISASTDVVEQNQKINTGTIQQNSKLLNPRRRRLLYNDSRNQCHLCGKCYSNRANLYRHQTISHTIDSKVINCTICNRSFKHKYSFREHLRSKHHQLLPSNRGIVGKKSRPNFNYKQGMAQYSCKVCEVEFSNNDELENHVKIHTCYQYECTDCGDKFETNVTLGEHILNCHKSNTILNGNNHTEIQMTSSQPIDKLKCKICSKVVKSASYLPVHMRIHTGVRPFKCEVCNMAFRFKPNLRIHKEIHYRANV